MVNDCKDVHCDTASIKKSIEQGFPCIVANSPLNTLGHELDPWVQKDPLPGSNEAHATQLLSQRSRAQEPEPLNPHAALTEAREPRVCAPRQEKPSEEKPEHRDK